MGISMGPVIVIAGIASLLGCHSIAGQTLSCGGHDGQEHHCAAETSRGVILLGETGSGRCLRGYSWDYEANEIWVDHGCAGEFALMSRRPVAWQQEILPVGKYLISCAAPAAQAIYCAPLPSANAELVRQTGEARCVEGKNWGVDPRGLWLANGCAADFVVRQRQETELSAMATRRVLECDSSDGRRNFCQVDARGGAVLRTTLGHQPCTLGKSWDYNEGGLWVDRGCRGVFEAEGAPETGRGAVMVRRCYLTVGEALASEWEAECYALRPGHFGSCNANQSCAALTATTRRGCQAKGDAAPEYCEKYLPGEE
ncbi:MAG TPA: DUF3011 domain-containing protein [Candidatus Eisenbacteria bacterium]|nr:DUF3011 domain-containing protein [Candidatus Eisenbacteria bacterium]